MSNEQWKDKGLCNECRRKNYCGKECTAHKRRVKYEMAKFVTTEMDKMTNGMYSEIMKHSPYKEQK